MRKLYLYVPVRCPRGVHEIQHKCFQRITLYSLFWTRKWPPIARRPRGRVRKYQYYLQTDQKAVAWQPAHRLPSADSFVPSEAAQNSPLSFSLNWSEVKGF